MRSKPGNVLIVRSDNGAADKLYSVRIADFGMDSHEDDLQEEDTSFYGTFEYMSPECYMRKYGVPCFASDVFSFGIILWEMWARERRFPGPAANGGARPAASGPCRVVVWPCPGAVGQAVQCMLAEGGDHPTDVSADPGSTAAAEGYGRRWVELRASSGTGACGNDVRRLVGTAGHAGQERCAGRATAGGG
eukprot:COSAG04_NODE_3264_length_2996_cov_1.937176_5_plen_191_part_00